MESAADNADAAVSRTLGQMLASERERQGLSRADAAQRLHMSAWQVEALEAGDYARLPKGTFLRGFVRNYAKVLGIEAEAALALLPEHAPRDRKPGIVVPTQNIRFDPLGERLQNPYVKATVLAAVAIAVGFAAMYWWLFIRPTPPASAGHKPAMQARVASPPPVTPVPVPVEAPKPVAAPAASVPMSAPAKPEPPKAEAKKAEPAKSEAAKVDASAPAQGEVLRVGTEGKVLRFVFKGASWVEIRDARGKVLLSRLNAAGSEAEVSGKPPMNVIVGNAPDVQVFYNDREFDLEPHTKVAVARFTVE